MTAVGGVGGTSQPMLSASTSKAGETRLQVKGGILSNVVLDNLDEDGIHR